MKHVDRQRVCATRPGRFQEYDPVVIATAAIALAMVAFAAGILPALKASRVDPMQALRYE